MAPDWESRLLAYLHDPPDKALDIRGHVARAARYAAVALGRAVESGEMQNLADILASVAERLPAPKGQVMAVGPVEGRLRVHHPLSGTARDLEDCHLDEAGLMQIIKAVLREVDDDRQARLLTLWRLLPERLASWRPWFALLPADTRIPDHTIWQHLDTTAALQAAEETNRGGAFLSFSLGPVQGFIRSARSVRDLWSGSMILSWLTFQAMLPILERYGPVAFVYPHLRGIPFVDRWLRQARRVHAGLPDPDDELRRAPCLPNRFLAVVPWGLNGGLAHELADQCQAAVRTQWCRLAEAVRGKLKEKLDPLDTGWDRSWHEQIEHFWDVQTAVLPLREITDEVATRLVGPLWAGAEPVRKLANMPREDRPGYDQDHAGRWQVKVELSARLMQAQRSVRHIPPSTTVPAGEEVPAKCSLMGSYEQMGPAGLNEGRRFWEGDPDRGIPGAAGVLCFEGVRLRPGERFCAVALAKRFCGPLWFSRTGVLDLPREALRFDDTASVAAAPWLEKHPELKREAENRHNSHWLHWSRRDQEAAEGEHAVDEPLWQLLRTARAKEKPPAYYAVLLMDGDDMGKWLRGENSRPVRELLHPELVKYFEGLKGGSKVGLDARRPLGPALHAALSEALTNFALHFVPRIVRDHQGTLIYAGGDDVLALLPTSRALACARCLRETFRQDWAAQDGREYLLPGKTATISGGLAVVHYKEDLRFALDQARRAESAAKRAGRDALSLTVCRRSGEHSTALCPWDFVPRVSAWMEAFLTQASDRWAYHLAAEVETLRGLDQQAMKSEIRRQLNRAETPTRLKLGETSTRKAGEVLAGEFDEYCAAVVNDKHRFDPGRALAEFVTLCQSASFLARGREQ